MKFFSLFLIFFFLSACVSVEQQNQTVLTDADFEKITAHVSDKQEPFQKIGSKNGTICFFENDCIEVELAQTQNERNKGLMFRQNLSENKGMLFLFDSVSIKTFWMKNTLIPLDIIWFDSNFVILGVSENTHPCELNQCKKYNSPKNTKFVLETNAGFFEAHNLNIGLTCFYE